MRKTLVWIGIFLLTTLIITRIVIQKRSKEPIPTNTIFVVDNTTPSSKPTHKSSPSPLPTALPIPQSVEQKVPFTSQAPLGEWSDPLQQDGCEEASSLMAMLWVRNQKLESSQAYKDAILNISQWELDEYDIAKDTSSKDTVKRIFNGYFKHHEVEAKTIVSFQEIIDTIAKGNLVIIPANGQKVGNPHYTPPGPERHMIVIKGYDLKTSEFITNDPGTRLGEGFRYNFQKLYDAIRDYPTGDHQPIASNDKTIIIIKKDPNFIQN